MSARAKWMVIELQRDVKGLDATVAVRIQSNCKAASLFHSKPSPCQLVPLSFLHSFLSICHQPSVDSDFCVAELYFFFVLFFLLVPLLPRLPARRLAAPVCQRWLRQNRLWEQPVSLPCSPSRGAAINPVHPPFFARTHARTHASTPAHTNAQPNTHWREKPYDAHSLSPIILGSNFISTRVAAYCRQPLQSFLINSRFVLHPSFWTHLSYIPIGAAPSTPGQPPLANPSASPPPALPHPEKL